MGGVTRPVHRGQQAVGGGAGQQLHVRGVGGQVDAGAEHTGHLVECLLDAGHAAGAGHAVDRQTQGGLRHLVAGAHHGGAQRGRVERCGRLDGGLLGGEVDARSVHAGHLFEGLLDAADAAGAGHAGDREGEAVQVHGAELEP